MLLFFAVGRPQLGAFFGSNFRQDAVAAGAPGLQLHPHPRPRVEVRKIVTRVTPNGGFALQTHKSGGPQKHWFGWRTQIKIYAFCVEMKQNSLGEESGTNFDLSAFIVFIKVVLKLFIHRYFSTSLKIISVIPREQHVSWASYHVA